jgi:hypothetical protein
VKLKMEMFIAGLLSGNKSLFSWSIVGFTGLRGFRYVQNDRFTHRRSWFNSVQR